ncbi:putative structural constituent of ribosome [Hesseltinella vesiculosa]|uniref:60S ribosomal protein L6 n=1 Tax=Hesseltinella vesiculosa TaxID=101127 RepID=A0A1X2G6R6_9FUNG|nr:putative structural constituent of ribosome [Hesseltinella vesiculosa]
MARNSVLVPGVSRYSRTAIYRKKGLYKIKKYDTAPAAKDAATDKVVEVKGAKNGGKRTIPANKASRFYPAEDIRQPKKSRKSVKTAPLRGSISAGSVVILLAGRHRGKRVVVLKQLDSGLLLVTGPFRVNGVPIRRVDQAYVIATSTKLELPEVDAKFNDAYFKKSKDVKEKEFLAKKESKVATSESKVADQKAVDKVILEAVAKTPFLRQYLAAKFSLSKGQFPHNMKF